MTGRLLVVRNLRSMINREFENGFDIEALVIYCFQEAASLVFVDPKTCSQNLVCLLLKNAAHVLSAFSAISVVKRTSGRNSLTYLF